VTKRVDWVPDFGAIGEEWRDDVLALLADGDLLGALVLLYRGDAADPLGDCVVVLAAKRGVTWTAGSHSLDRSRARGRLRPVVSAECT
jgi:hypothetical protein